MGFFTWLTGLGSDEDGRDSGLDSTSAQSTSVPTVSVDDFAVAVPEAVRERDGYLYMSHGDKYTLRLKNELRRRCDAKAYIDGQHVGTWRIGSRRYIDLERPIHSDKRFTFYAVGTPEAEAADIDDDEETGLIRVAFKPEQVERPDEPAADVRFQRFQTKAGGTGLSGESSQRFQKATPIEYDESAEVVIHARLITEDSPDSPQPLGAKSDLGPKSNDVPPPV